MVPTVVPQLHVKVFHCSKRCLILEKFKFRSVSSVKILCRSVCVTVFRPQLLTVIDRYPTVTDRYWVVTERYPPLLVSMINGYYGTVTRSERH